MSQAPPIVIVCSADARYVRPLAVTLASAAAHLPVTRRLSIHIIDGGIPESDKALLTQSIGTPSLTVCWHDPPRTHLVGVPLWGRMSIGTYDKLLMPDVLPSDLDQVLWLDGDTLVLTDLGQLWDRGAGRYSALAVQDALVPLVSSPFGVARYRDLGLSPETKYFNAGVLLINLELWRRHDVVNRAIDYVKRYADQVAFWDQEGLNAVLAGTWGELDESWNWSVSHHSHRDLREASAKIVHFTGNLKPWRYDGRHTYYPTYYEYVDRTAWSGWRPDPGWRSAAIRSYEHTILRRALPESVGTYLWMGLTRRLATPKDLRSSTA